MTSDASADDDRFDFLPDEPAAVAAASRAPWQVLVVDDDADVHESTVLGLQGLEVLGRGLSFLHAYSAAQAEALLERTPEVAVVLLDVVMEDHHAGLSLVDRIRRTLGLHNLRIILRTGQPGYAPELDAIRDYDINDYKTKGELTRHKLFTTLTTAIRSYDQIRRLDESRRGLELIIRASNQFIAHDGLQPFAVGVITQLAALIGVQAEGLVCAQSDDLGDPFEPPPATLPADYIVIAAAGRYASLVQQPVARIDDERVRTGIARCLGERRTLIEDDRFVLFIPGRQGRHFAAFVDSPQAPGEPDRHLLEVFCSNIAMCAQNIQLVANLHEAAYQDRLVQLPNRPAFVKAIDAALDRDDCHRTAVVLLDIDQFAETNEAFGYAYGDALLRAVAQRLQERFADSCQIARISNDTFGLIGPSHRLTPAQLQEVFAAPFVLPAGEHAATASAGIVLLDDQTLRGRHGAGVLENCYQALKQAKTGGHGSHAYYTPAFGHDVRGRTRLLQDLRQAFAQQNLHLCYQPQIDLASGRPVGLEALMRWRGPDGQYVPPERFIAIAEQSGLIGALGEWALRAALADLVTLRSRGIPPLRMAVNVSALQFLTTGFADRVLQALEEAGVAPQSLELEITESVAMSDPTHAQATMARLKNAGVGLSIDDFGTGFSSLSYLDRLPVDRLKIDRSFVAAHSRSADAGRIAPMVVGLGHALGLKVVAEGVETAEQAQWLTRLGCDEAQGFLFARPMPLADVERWLLQPQPDTPPSG